MKNSQKEYQVLIIDDHPVIAESYQRAFSFIEMKQNVITFEVQVCNDCDTAHEFIQEITSDSIGLTLVFLDISLPPSKDGKILSGEDLGILIRELLPETKIIVSTSFNDNHRMYSIIKNINPDGFLVKSDISSKEIVTAINEVINGASYFSRTVSELLRKQISNDFVLDAIDRKILFEISMGAKTKELKSIVPLSIAGIEKRKRHLKVLFGAKEASDRELISLAKEKGFI